MSRGLVYIASLSHSGSTLLDLLLGLHPKLVGLGEVSKVLNYDATLVDENLHMACTCGKRTEDCAFWGEFLNQLRWLEDNSPHAKYEALLAHFHHVYEEDVQLVDSSKYRAGLETINSLPDMNFRVIFLIKDVRSFCNSHRLSTETEIEIGRLPKLLNSARFSQWFYSRSIKSPSYLFWKWFLRNRAMLRYLENEKIEHLVVSYDQLAREPEMQISRIFEFLKLDPLPSGSLVPAQSASHIFLGNPMIGDQDRMQSVRYDDRWQSRAEWQRAAGLYSAIMEFNERMVYEKESIAAGT